MLSLTQGGVANIPLWMEALDGNSSDKSSFHVE
jgi:transposase